MNVLTHLLEGDLYSEDEFNWANHCMALFLLRGAEALAKRSSEDGECEICSDIESLLEEYFETMDAVEEAFGKHKRPPAEEITLDALRDRLSLGQRVVIYDKATLEKHNFRIVEDPPKKEAVAKIGKPRKAA